ncbi:uncharacterized protein LOC119991469 [Tripterygium wilfordii]|uniref:uncharacterized protein LOC119991469 n=1 Tax=Tripterygium wilfordii TaxID=458696 RepID=UPI0018F80B69|nr:uncharacterized protein LOC119991469 [Tripterygium wilfordii]
MNVDAAREKDGLRSAVGCVARNSNGRLTIASAVPVGLLSSVESAESYAIREGIKLAIEAGLEHVTIASDSKGVVAKINAQDSGLNEDGSIIGEIQMLREKLRYCKVSYYSRNCNNVVHSIAKFSLTCSVPHIWNDSNELRWLQEAVMAYLLPAVA